MTQASDSLTRGARGGGVVVIGQMVKVVVRFTGLVMLSRLLDPADFGLVAMVAVFLTLGDLLRDFGMPTATLTAQKLSHQQASNLFWVNGALGLAAAALLTLSTPLLVSIYSEPRLSVIAPVMALSLVLNGFQAQLQIQLSRAGRFVALTLTDIGSMLVGILAATGAALVGWGYWALVIQPLLGAVVMIIWRWWLLAWAPSLPRRGHGSKSLVSAGGNYGLANLLQYFSANADTMAIGSYWGAIDLGLYSRAFQIATVPKAGLTPLTQVVIPTLNAARQVGRSIQDLLLRIQFGLGCALVWVYVVLAASAPWLLPWLLGEQWGPAAPMLIAHSFGGLFAAFSSVSFWTFLSENKSRDLMRLHLITKPMTVLMVVFAVPHGTLAVAWAYSWSLALAWPINLAWLKRVVDQDAKAFGLIGLRILAAAALAYVGSYLIGAQLTLGNLAMALTTGGSASFLFFGALLAAPATRHDLLGAVRDVRALVQR